MQKRLRLAALLLAVPVLGACGFNAQTDAVYQPAVGTNVRDSQVDVLGAVIVSGTPGSGVLLATLSNESQTRSDRLTGIDGSDGVQVAIGQQVEMQPTGAVNLADADQGGGITVSGTAVNAVKSNFITLRMTFQHADPVTIGVPVVAPTGPYASYGAAKSSTPNDTAAQGSQGAFGTTTPSPAG